MGSEKTRSPNWSRDACSSSLSPLLGVRPPPPPSSFSRDLSRRAGPHFLAAFLLKSGSSPAFPRVASPPPYSISLLPYFLYLGSRCSIPFSWSFFYLFLTSPPPSSRPSSLLPLRLLPMLCLEAGSWGKRPPSLSYNKEGPVLSRYARCFAFLRQVSVASVSEGRGEGRKGKRETDHRARMGKGERRDRKSVV